MAKFNFYQVNGGEEAWHEVLAESRQALIATLKPRFITVLAVSALITETSTREDINALKYSGPLYFDWDAPDIETCLAKFRQFLDKLREADVDLNSIRLFATGGRGFHCEIPAEIFLPKVPKAGIQFLPGIYKEMCFDLYTDTMDLRVYSARKGRMWRTPNVARENGKFKVPLTVDEALNMTVEDYAVLCSAERVAPQIAPPVFNQKLGVMYAKAEQKVADAAKKRKNASKDLELLARFKGQYPPSLLKVMQGEGSGDIGFHQIAMQIAITSNALGKKEEEMLTLCEPLIQNHQSDGVRYNTPQKRKNELSRMFRYTADNVCYTYNRDAVRKLVPNGAATPDLDGLSEKAGEVISAGDGEDEDDEYLGGVFLTDRGIYKKGEDGVKQISDVSFLSATLLHNAHTGKDLGLEAEVLVKGQNRGLVLMDQATFLNRANFQRFAMAHRGGFKGNDNDIVSVSTILGNMAMSNGGLVYMVNREGLDVIQRPGSKQKGDYDLMWVSHEKVDTASEIRYKHRGDPNDIGLFHSDLFDSPPLSGSEHEAGVIEAMFNLNTQYSSACMIGWLVSAFHRQIYHRFFKQFPLLSVFGQAGCGKSKTIEALMHMHYFLSDPIIASCDQASNWAIQGQVKSSASIPIVLDEYKPTQLKQGRHSFLKGMFRSAYTADTFMKGGRQGEIGSSYRDLHSDSLSGPIIFIGEYLEGETAVMERSVIVPLQKTYIVGREKYFNLVRDHSEVLSSLGRDILSATFALKSLADFKASVDSYYEEATALIGRGDNHRPVFNLAVVLHGLEFLRQVLKHRFDDRFQMTIEQLKAAASDVQLHVASTVMSEPAKVLNCLALMSNTEDPGTEVGLRQGMDYEYVGADMIDIKVRNCYVKYVAWSKRKGITPLYENEEGYIHGLANFGPLRNKAAVIDSPLKVSGVEKIYRFSVQALAKEGVEPFKGAL
jgi:hypothetical protein